jgi:hypothetical protein
MRLPYNFSTQLCYRSVRTTNLFSLLLFLQFEGENDARRKQLGDLGKPKQIRAATIYHRR